MHTLRQRRLFIRNAAIAVTLGALALLLGTPAKAYEQQFLPSNAYGQVEFVMPSGNIGCVYTPAGGTPIYSTQDGRAEISCDRVEPFYVRGVLGERGTAVMLNDVGDAGCCGAGPVFHYEHYVQLGPFQCLATQKGLTCAREDGHGFFMSRNVLEAR